MKTRRFALLCTMFLVIGGCSSGDDQGGSQAGGNHAWTEQVGTIDKARATEQTVMEAAAKQAEVIRQQTE